MRSISRKIMLSIFLCTFVMAALILGTFNTIGSRIISGETSAKNQLFLESQVKDLNQLFHTSEQMVTELSSLLTDGIDYERFRTDPDYAKGYLESRKGILANFSKNDANIMGLYTYFDPAASGRVDSLWFVRNEATGVMEQSDDESSPSEFAPDNADYIWFYGPMDAKGLFWTPLYVDKDLGVSMISCTYPLFVGDQIVGMVGVDINFKIFSDMLGTMKVGESGYAAMIDSDGTILSHPTLPQEQNLGAVSDGLHKPLFEAMVKNGQGTFSYSEKGQEHRVSYTQASNGKFFMFDMLKNEMFSNLNTLRNIMLGIAAASILGALLLSFLLGRSIGRPIVALSNAANRLAVGDIGVKLETTSRDEVGVLTESFMKMVDNIKDNVHVAENIASGNIDVAVHIKSEQDILGRKQQEMINAIRAMVEDSTRLADAAVEGKLDVRANASRHGGDFRKIVEGVNRTLDAVILPVKEAGAVLSEMAKGNLKLRVQGDYRGDNAAIKTALNTTLDALSVYVEEISRTLEEMADSNLALEIRNDYKGDFARIKEALNIILASFNSVLSEINEAADQVASGSKRLSEGSQNLSQGAMAQAGAIDELTVSIAQISAHTMQNARNADQANQLALTAREKATASNNSMDGMLSAMQEINESSKGISKIIKIIDSIAFQTNILALNAAVEAARAGQHGKGFAVVAEEVRNLAAQSADAAKETTAMIENSMKKVSDGARIANETALMLNQVTEGIATTAELVGDIALSSKAQSSEISQINVGVEQVSRVIQTNSATAEECAAASEELSGQSHALKDRVGEFRLLDHRSGKRGGSLSFNTGEDVPPQLRLSKGDGKEGDLLQ